MNSIEILFATISILFFIIGATRAFEDEKYFCLYCDIISKIENRVPERNVENKMDGYNFYQIEKYFGIWTMEYKRFNIKSINLLGERLHFSFMINHLCILDSFLFAAIFVMLQE